MYQLKNFEFKASDISVITASSLIGIDIAVNNIARIGEESDNSIILFDSGSKDVLLKISKQCLVFCTNDMVIENKNLSFIICDDPKLSFYRFLNEYLVSETSYRIRLIVSEKSIEYPDVDFGYNIKIGFNVIIAPGTKIGTGTFIGCNVVICKGVEIGSYCKIKDNSVIGTEGFGYIRSGKELIQIPKVGRIIIGNHVDIGSCSTIEKPVSGSTIIHDNVKIDDLVQIGQNQEIGKSTVIATGFKAEGGILIGENSFIGMGVTVISENITIGTNCLIGAGTVLTKSIEDNKRVYSKSDIVIDDVKNKLSQIFSSPRK